MGTFVGSLDFWGLGSVALGTVGVGKGERKVGNVRIKKENSVKITIAKIPSPHGFLGSVFQEPPGRHISRTPDQHREPGPGILLLHGPCSPS